MSSIRTNSPDLAIELDRSRPRGLRVQIEGELRAAVRSGRLAPGTALPSSRALAADLGVTRGVVVGAYDQLIAEGYLRSRQGSGTIVNATAGAAAHPPSAAQRPGPPVTVDFHPGVPDIDLFPRAAWGRATRTALQTLPDPDLGYIDSRGLAEARRAVAEYVGRARGVSADPDNVVICNGFGHGLSLVASVLRRAGHEVVAVEDPGYDGARDTLALAGLRCRGVPVDGEGLVVDGLGSAGVRTVIVTPAHQNPTGAVLSSARRTALVEWARVVDGYVIEDDYDAEYRYDRHPAGAIQGLDPARVVYSGTTSKSLAPGLRLGWLVLPGELVEQVTAVRRPADSATSSLLQSTFAAFLAAGDLDRHLRRTRLVYRRRRDALLDALARWFPGATPGGVSAGLQVAVTLPAGTDEARFVEHALQAGVRAYPLGRYRVGPRPRRGGPAGLVLGYGHLTPAELEEGARLLGEVAAALSG